MRYNPGMLSVDRQILKPDSRDEVAFPEGYGCVHIPNRQIQSIEELASLNGISGPSEEDNSRDLQELSQDAKQLIAKHGVLLIRRSDLSPALAEQLNEENNQAQSCGYKKLKPFSLARIFHCHPMTPSESQTIHFLYDQTEVDLLTISHSDLVQSYQEMFQLTKYSEIYDLLRSNQTTNWWVEDLENGGKQRIMDDFSLFRYATKGTELREELEIILDFFRDFQQHAIQTGRVNQVDLSEYLAVGINDFLIHAADSRAYESRPGRPMLYVENQDRTPENRSSLLSALSDATLPDAWLRM